MWTRLRRYFGQFNQSEMGAPAHSEYGQGLRAREADASGLRNQTYLPGPFPFRDQIGAVVIPPYALVPVVHREGYAGVAPLDLQSQVRKPHPWEDRSRGRP
jgi:hypothetical protein